MKKLMMFTALSMAVLATACGKKDAVAPCVGDECTTPPPPPPPPPSAPVVVGLAGNIGYCNGYDAATASIIDTLGATAKVFAVGGIERRTGCYDASWGRFKARSFAAIGNEEIDTLTSPANANTYFTYWGTQGGELNKGWQALDVGDWRVIVLNVNDYSSRMNASYGPGSEQRLWLSNELNTNASRRCTMVVMHNAYFLSSSGATPWTTRGNLQSLFAQFFAAGVDLVVTGNEHRYERFAPMDQNGNVDAVRGVRQINVGTGGASIDRVQPTWVHAGSERTILNYGVLRLKLNSDGYEYAFINAENPSDTDAGTGSCH